MRSFRSVLIVLMSVTLVSALIASAASKAPRNEQSPCIPEPHSPNRHPGFLKQAESGKCGLLFLGDSITDFWPGKGKDTWQKFAKYNPLDFGVSGDTTENVLWRITNGELDKIHPKVTVIMIGTNNFGHYKDKPEWVAGGVKKIIDTVHEKIPDTRILLLAIFPRADKGSELRNLVDECNQIISKFDDGKSVRYLDIGPKFLDADGNLPKDVMPDKLHPNAKGYQIWYDAMMPTLEEMMK